MQDAITEHVCLIKKNCHKVTHNLKKFLFADYKEI